jgi:fucose permease
MVSLLLGMHPSVHYTTYFLILVSLELLIWFTPSLVGDAIFVSIIGLLLGPMYPITMNHSGKVLPPWILTGAIGWLAGFGQAGSALLPFMTGAVAEKWGIRSLQPL